MALRCAIKFNRTQNTSIFEQMIRISVTGALAKLSLEKSRLVINCLQKVSDKKPNQLQSF